LTVSQVVGTTYHVKTNGNDSASGWSDADAWKSLDKVNKSTFSPGDSILFKRGDQWRGMVEITDSGSNGLPITVADYGSGKKPVINGAIPVSGWSVYSGAVYQASVSNTIQQLFLDGVPLMLARHPNSGYLFVDTKLSSSQFVDSELPDWGWMGARVHSKSANWILRSDRDISAYDPVSHRVTLEANGSISATWGYFINNAFDALDSPGEWYLDSSNHTLYVWLPDGGNPTDHLLEGSTYDHGIRINNRSYLNIRNLEIRYPVKNGVTSDPKSAAHRKCWMGTDILIDSVDVYYPDRTGIRIVTYLWDSENCGVLPQGWYGGRNITIQNCTVEGANEYGMNLSLYDTSVVSNNVIRDVGRFDRLNVTGLGQTTVAGSGLRLRGNGALVVHNRIEDVGRRGIDFGGLYQTIKNNVIIRPVKTVADAGGIYAFRTASTGTVIRGNIILDAVGDISGSPWTTQFGMGIYIDHGITDVIVESNTVAGSTADGILIQNCTNFNIVGNVCYNNAVDRTDRGEILLANTGPHTLQSNILFATRSNRHAFKKSSGVSLSSSDHNVFANPYTRESGGSGNDSLIYDGGTGYWLSDWQAFSGLDTHSSIHPVEFETNEAWRSVLLYNDTQSDKDFILAGGPYIDLYGDSVGSPVTLSPFSSTIVLNTGASNTPSQNPLWWTDWSVIDTNATPEDYAVANLGQLKLVAMQAYEEFEEELPGGAGSNLTVLVDGFVNSNNYQVVNQGQLKAVAQPFYDRLWELGLTNAYPVGVTNQYPWEVSTPAPNDYSVANIGQLKYLFSFEVE